MGFLEWAGMGTVVLARRKHRVVELVWRQELGPELWARVQP